jgi:hypothetical protein
LFFDPADGHWSGLSESSLRPPSPLAFRFSPPTKVTLASTYRTVLT